MEHLKGGQVCLFFSKNIIIVKMFTTFAQATSQVQTKPNFHKNILRNCMVKSSSTSSCLENHTLPE
jgi:hypothetical protein